MNKVIEYKPREKKKQFSATERKAALCTHLSIEVDEAERKVYCRECGKEIDPFAWIMILVKQERRAESRWFYCEREAKKIEDRYSQKRQKRIEKLKSKTE